MSSCSTTVALRVTLRVLSAVVVILVAGWRVWQERESGGHGMEGLVREKTRETIDLQSQLERQSSEFSSRFVLHYSLKSLPPSSCSEL